MSATRLRLRLRARTRVVALASVLVVALLTAGCLAWADAGSSGQQADSGATPGAEPSPESGLHTYVALGDSYTAAPLFHAEDQLQGCLRSPDNYPAMVAQRWGLQLTDVSCSGATTGNLVKRQVFSHGGRPRPPQFRALTPETDLVTVGIGANDFRFFGRMIIDCLAMAHKKPHGSPCEEANAVSPAPQRIEDKLDLITRHVSKVVRGIDKRSPEARVLMVGYPQLIPSSGMCKRKLPLADGDYGFVRRLNLQLADAVKAGALSSGAEFVDLIPASQGHDICSKHPWIAGVRGPQRKALGLHPYRREQKAVARLIGDVLASPAAS